jgi:DNA ligase-1
VKQFAALFESLDSTTSTHAKLDALVRYFQEAPASDAAWAAYFLAGGRPKLVVPTKLLRRFACQFSGFDEWLFEECYQAVGDLAETIAYCLPVAIRESDLGLAQWVERLGALSKKSEFELYETLCDWWSHLKPIEIFLTVKLIGGGFRVGVSKLLVIKALAIVADIDAKIIAERFMGYTDTKRAVTDDDFLRLIAPVGTEDEQALGTQPFPFFLAHPLQADCKTLGDISDWLVERKFDGIRAQIVKRNGLVAVWSRGEELLTERFPELVSMAAQWPDGTVLDGEIVVWLHNTPAPFALLQKRITRKIISKKLLEQTPVVFMAYDYLERTGKDIRASPQTQRREYLEHFVADMTGNNKSSALKLSPRVITKDWDSLLVEKERCREQGVEGFMLKAASAQYGIGRTKESGVWLKWKVDPMTIDCVLIYAQRGHGRRASLYSDYTFAVWSQAPTNEAQAQEVAQAIMNREPIETTTQRGLPYLVPFAKAYSGLTDDELKLVDAIINKNTIDKFGPVRSVKPCLVFELGFEGIAQSSRHKSGIAVRFPRILRIRTDKLLHEADSLDTLQKLLLSHHG